MNWIQQIAEWLARFKCWYIVRPWEESLLVRCGRWQWSIGPGFHLRLPLLDEVFVQNTRTRVLNLPVQTVTNKGGQCVTLSAIVRWRIASVRTIYHRLHNPEDWIYNCVLAAVGQAVHSANGSLSPAEIAAGAEESLAESSAFGIEIEGVAITDFAIVKTYRLISGEGNAGWSWNRVGTLDQPTHK